jgi:hypothetical protein
LLQESSCLQNHNRLVRRYHQLQLALHAGKRPILNAPKANLTLFFVAVQQLDFATCYSKATGCRPASP